MKRGERARGTRRKEGMRRETRAGALGGVDNGREDNKEEGDGGNRRKKVGNRSAVEKGEVEDAIAWWG